MKAEVRLQISVSMPERLLQHALAQGAEFACIRRSCSRSIIADCDERSADILLALCRQYHLNCSVLRRRGPGALRDKLRSRITLAAGILLCIALCSFCLSRIWIIDIAFTGSGARLGRESDIIDVLTRRNVHPGMKITETDADILQKQLLAEAGAYSHIGVRIQGIRLFIEAAPEIPPPETYILSDSRDLVAAMDGVVKSVSVRSGKACVKPGDIVRRGQLLIRGEEDKSPEETSAVGALGEVLVRSWFEGSAQGDLIENRQRRTGSASASVRIRLGPWSLPLREGMSFAQFECETETLPIVGLFLPLEVIRETRFETETAAIDANPAALENRLRSLAQADARLHLAASGPTAWEITDYREETVITDNTLRLRAVYEIAADIAVTRDALIEEVNLTWKPPDK